MSEPSIIRKNIPESEIEQREISIPGLPPGTIVQQSHWQGYEVATHPEHPEWGWCAIQFPERKYPLAQEPKAAPAPPVKQTP